MLHVHVLPPTNQTCLAINPVVTHCEKLLQNVEVLSFLFFLTGNQIHSADIPLRMKVVFSKLKQFTIQGRLFRFEFSSL